MREEMSTVKCKSPCVSAPAESELVPGLVLFWFSFAQLGLIVIRLTTTLHGEHLFWVGQGVESF